MESQVEIYDLFVKMMSWHLQHMMKDLILSYETAIANRIIQQSSEEKKNMIVPSMATVPAWNISCSMSVQ